MPTATDFVMDNWHVFSSQDLAHWTDHGPVLGHADFSWAIAAAFAGHCIERDGRFYWYVPMWLADGGGFGVGVAVADSPTGPFSDARGTPLVTNDMTPLVLSDPSSTHDDIDPAVFIDDDGQAYMYFGGLWEGQLECWKSGTYDPNCTGPGFFETALALMKTPEQTERLRSVLPKPGRPLDM